MVYGAGGVAFADHELKAKGAAGGSDDAAITRLRGAQALRDCLEAIAAEHGLRLSETVGSR